MSSYRTELGPVAFDPARRAYTATVRFHEGNDVEAYECSLSFPVETEMAAVAAALVRQAREKRRKARVPITSRFVAKGSNVVPFVRSRRKSVPGLRRSA